MEGQVSGEVADLVQKLDGIKKELVEGRVDCKRVRPMVALLEYRVRTISHLSQQPLDCDENPLLNHVVMQNVSRYMNFHTLKTARLVSSKWNAMLFPVFEKRAKIHVEFNTKKSIEDFTATFKTSNEHHKIIRSVHLPSVTCLDFSTMMGWMKEYGQNFTNVKLGYDYPPNEACRIALDNNIRYPNGRLPFEIGVKALRAILLDWCPNLKELSIPIPLPRAADANHQVPAHLIKRMPAVVHLERLEIGEHKSKYRVGYILKEVLGCVASVDTLVLKCAAEFGWTDLINRAVLPPAPALPVSDEQPQPSTSLPVAHCSLRNIVHLDLQDCPVSASIFSTLLKVGCKSLKVLQLGQLTGYSNDNAIAFSNLLQSLAGSLEVLNLSKLDFAMGSYTVPKLSAMTNLRELHWSLIHWEFEGLDLVALFPNLEVLSIPGGVSDDFVKALRLRLGQKPHKKLRSLLLTKTTSFEKGLILAQKIPLLFPFLQHLDMSATGAEFIDVLKNLTSLRMLKTLKIYTQGTIGRQPYVNLPFSFSVLQKVTLCNYSVTGEFEELNLRDMMNVFFRCPTMKFLKLYRFEIDFAHYIRLLKTRGMTTKLESCRMNT